MNKLSYISNKYKENDIEGEDFGAELYNILNLPQKNLYGARKAEIIALLFGAITNTQVRRLKWPYVDMDPETINRTLSREVRMGNMVQTILKKEDNGARRIYGLTRQGHERICKTIGITENSYPLRNSIRFHEYALGLFFQTLISHGYKINFQLEQLISQYELKSTNTLNKKFSVRADGILYVYNKKYYIEQDMGTETIGKLVGKIKYYNDSSKTIIFSFYKAVQKLKINYQDVLFLDEKYKTSEKMKKALNDENLSNEHKKILDIYLSRNENKSLADAVAVEINAYSDILRLEKQYNFKTMRLWGMFNYILGQSFEKELCLKGMHLYCVTPELAYASNAFRRFGTKGKSCKIFKRLYGKNIVYERLKKAHGACFDECIHIENGNVYIEYVEDDVAGLVRAYLTYKSIMVSNDKLLIHCNSDSFAEKVAQLFCEKINYLGHNIIFILEGENEYYEVKFGTLIPVAQY